MTSHHPTELDSVTMTPRSEHRMHDEPRVRFMCSFGGKILPRLHDNQLRYVGGDTRIVAVNRHATFSSLLEKLSNFSGTSNISIKYQLPNEDLDALITIINDEDLENMMEEYDHRLAQNHTPHSKMARLRLFLFPNDPVSRTSSISSLLNGSANREQWFFDALNGGMGPGSGLERGRSEASSLVSEVPDYLFGPENSDDPPRESQMKTRPIFNDNISTSDPVSPAPVFSSAFCSTTSGLGPSYMGPIPDLGPVNTKPDNPVSIAEPNQSLIESAMDTGELIVLQPLVYGGDPMWHYAPGTHYPSPAMQNMPVYHLPVPGPPPENVAVQQVLIPDQCIQKFSGPPVGLHQPIPGMGQVNAREVRSVPGIDPYDTRRAIPGGVNQQVYYDMRNAGVVVPMYSGMVVPGGEEIQGAVNPGRAP